ncbi:unnamed protein product, partial [Rotaria magnacalcarata]
LKYVEDAILQQEETEGVASSELRQLRADLREALSLFNPTNSNIGKDKLFSLPISKYLCLDESVITIDDSESATCVTLSSDSESSDDDEEENSIVKEIVGS